MSDLSELDRQQREAAFKGEMEAQSRLPQFLPQDPLAGAALQELEHIEEEVWQEQVRVQNLLESRKGESAIRGVIPDEDIIGARKSLERVNQWGGELDENSVDQFVIQVAPRLRDRPRYEQKNQFYKWLRKMEAWSRGEEDAPVQYDLSGKTAPGHFSPEERREMEEREKLQKSRGVPQPFPGLDDASRPEGIEVG